MRCVRMRVPFALNPLRIGVMVADAGDGTGVESLVRGCGGCRWIRRV